MNRPRKKLRDRQDNASPARLHRKATIGAFVLLLLCGAHANATRPGAWQQEQTFTITAPGLIKLSLPVATLDAAQPALADLRLYDDAGAEVPWLVERPLPGTAALLPARTFQATLNSDVTSLLVETGTTQAIDGILLETPAQNFIKPVRVEGSPDGQRWQLIATGRPLFRQAGGVSQLQLALPRNVWHSLRLTVDDRRSAPLPFTGARLHVPAATVTPAETLPVAIAAQHENPGETRLTLNLGAANLDLAALHFETAAPLFTRSVTLAVPQVSETAIHEETVGQGVIYRLALDGQTNLENLMVPLERQIPSRELVVLLRNQDSPPLAITAVRAERRPVYLIFLAPHAGTYHLLTGNPRATPPHYDLTPFAANLKTVGVSPVQLSALTANPDYHAPETLPDVTLTGPELDTKGWKYRKPVQISQPGVQQLELDLDVLAHAQSDFGDLRLMTTDRQVPYVIEHTSIQRELAPEVTVVHDAKAPKISRWRLVLPQARLPLSHLSCTAATTLFQRQLGLYEELTDDRGGTYRQSLGSASWNQTPDARRTEFTLVLDHPPQSNTLFLETDNGDNPPLELDHFQVFHPVTRVLFKISSAMPVALYYGNPGVTAPRYDLSLVANQLLAAPKVSATGGTEEQLRKASWAETRVPGRGGVLFWGILAGVVAGLLFVIARLLPKSAPPPDQP